MTRVIELIYSDEKTIGKGTEEDPVRRMVALYTRDGKPVMVVDTLQRKGVCLNHEILTDEASK
jgi:hypothetical protein